MKNKYTKIVYRNRCLYYITSGKLKAKNELLVWGEPPVLGGKLVKVKKKNKNDWANEEYVYASYTQMLAPTNTYWQ